MSKKSGLGRGLNALITDHLTEEEQIFGLPLMVSITDMTENPEQPRQNFPEKELNILAESIKVRGILEPLLVRTKENGKYELIAGERRLRAAKIAGLSQVPVLLRDDISEAVDLLEVALIENLYREDLNPIDEALSYMRLAKEFNRSQGDIAQLTGKDRSTITNFMRLLNLPKVVQDDVQFGRLNTGQARALLGLNDHERILQARQEVLINKLTVRQTESLVRRMLKPKKKTSYLADNDYYSDLENKISQNIGLTVKVNYRNKKSLEIKYNNDFELEKLIKILTNN